MAEKIVRILTGAEVARILVDYVRQRDGVAGQVYNGGITAFASEDNQGVERVLVYLEPPVNRVAKPCKRRPWWSMPSWLT